MKKSKLINQLISRPNTPINTPTQNQFTNCELEQIDKQAVEKKNCKECLHFEACCKWTDFPRQIGFPTCRKFNPVESYRKQSENTVEVVRCKDCRWFQRENWDGEILYGCDCSAGMNDINPDDFCSCGEPKMKGGAE